jgi:hypothetical protein
MKLIGRYNQFYNDECAASPWGGITSMEHFKQPQFVPHSMRLPASMV